MARTLFKVDEIEKSVHCFEHAGLGKAPFTYVGMIEQNKSESLFDSGMVSIGSIGGCSIETKPGGTCDYCGTYIVNMFRVRSSDGKTFKVGCDCIEKCGDEGIIHLVREDVKKHKKRIADLKKEGKRRADLETLLLLPKVSGKLAGDPHPSDYFARDGKTMLDYVRWAMSSEWTVYLAAKTIRKYLTK